MMRVLIFVNIRCASSDLNNLWIRGDFNVWLWYLPYYRISCHRYINICIYGSSCNV